ncbi:3-oxoacyl-[acyl-carrier-protein] reductase FabG-like [Pectinophora gossypiella]|uniref:3-oxoacyl-[acyl-carrier-protein] reductase FabG-like n=1 Tax=Pectinophora gossypiella TaxID=13191 RepID=UPI00214E6FF6|nr:3-oxoacyl-[acyl-carrier-protein] reductase FabG-like [Pectinophora gossypiella]
MEAACGDVAREFADKVVLVTGASAGIGKATALLFASRGARLSLVAWDADASALQAVGLQCRAYGHEPLLIHVDLSTDEGCERTAKDTLAKFGRLDILVNNAGIGGCTTLEKTDMATFDRVFALNVRAVYNLTRLLAPALVRARGNVVNVSSTAAEVACVGLLPYAMSKAAVSHFTRLIALELAPKGVRVNAVCPGVVDTNLVQRMTGITEEEYREWLRQAERGIPLGRACVGADVAAMIAHLAGAGAAAVTGATVPVDGGLRFMGAGALVPGQL